MPHIAQLHAALLLTIVLALAAVGATLAVSGWRRRAATSERAIGSLGRAGLWICELLIAAECLLGVALWWNGLRPAQPELHVIYGCVALLTLPALWRYTRAGSAAHRSMALGIGCIVLCAIVLRALATGRPHG